MSWLISFDRPQWLWLLLAVPAIVAVSTRSLAGLDRRRRISAVALRSLVVAALACALARIEYVRRNDHLAVMFVLDRSRSVPEDLRQAAHDYIKAVARKADADDRIGMIGFDGTADVDLIPSRGGVEYIPVGMAVEPDRTNIAGGLRLALAAFPEGFARRVVILTDGNENAGDLREEVEAALADRVAVDIVPLQYRHTNEILFDRIVVPAQAHRDTRIPVRLIVKSKRPAKARLTLYHNDVEVPLADPVITLTGDMRPDRIDIPIALHSGGVHRFDARLAPLSAEADSIVENNSATGFTFVDDQGRVLILSGAGPADDAVLRDALQREKIDVELRSLSQLRESIDLLKLQEYSVVVLSNVSADEFNESQHRALASFVKDFGGGLIMTGGNEAFGAGGWIGSPVEEVSPVSFEVKHKKLIPRGALVIIMHSCEIPRGNYWGEQVAIAAVKTISSLDYLGVLCYSFGVGGPNWDVPLAPATNKPAIISKMKQMQIGDMPDFASTMNIAVQDLMALPDVSQRHVIIISDGDPAAPSQATLDQMKVNQITCSTVGIGYGSHVMEPTLIRIAKEAGGRFYPVRNPNRLPQIFVKEAKVVKRPLIDDRPFQPRLLFGFAETTLGISDAELPALGGLVLTTPKADALMPIARRSTDGDDPVLAHWNYEMGKMVVFTSGWWPKWGANWAAWEKFGKFWAQVVRWAMRQTGAAEFDVVTRLEGNRGKVLIEALNKDASYLNFLSVKGVLSMPSGESKPLRLSQTGPGQYEGDFEVNDNGNYLVGLRYRDPDNESGMIRTGLSVPYSPEFRELGTNLALLQQTMERTGGRMLEMVPEHDDVFSRDLPPSVSRQPVWRWVVQWLLLPLFLLDVAARRLASPLAMSLYVEVAVLATACAALYAADAPAWAYGSAVVLAEVVGWTVRYPLIVPTVQFFTSSVTALARAGQRSSQALRQLKGVRDRVREGLRPERPERAPKPEPATIPLDRPPDPRARFDAGDEGGAEPVGELTEALGGAAAREERAATETEPGKPGRPPEPAPGDLTARLLKAKRRARDAMDDRGKGS